ncbi:hypothetical protein H072_4861 [Dactylellina haptotyla CBS 200.50]|uniref:Protein kinase domain-containing protein n=1 Tax=Dactylellina haptotyla (strain CBS 200.50) TaxID=1284197 RepID=S8AJE3_DACHA|nr:hypothetical protein H072_4861 [Dactylellina haptotyla CBS 200.50]
MSENIISAVQQDNMQLVKEDTMPAEEEEELWSDDDLSDGGLKEHDLCLKDIFPNGYVYYHKPEDYVDRGSRYILKIRGMAVKYPAEEREIAMAQLCGPGDCGVKILGHTYYALEKVGGTPFKTGITMEIAQPIRHNIANFTDDEKRTLKEEMIALLERLHDKYNMVHGDIKPANFVRCTDGKLRMCDFETSRPADEDPALWGVKGVGRYTSQYRCPTRPDKAAPTKFDDWYAMAVSIWEIYTVKMPFEGWEYMYRAHLERQTVDVSEVKCLETREWIKGILQKGGAKV